MSGSTSSLGFTAYLILRGFDLLKEPEIVVKPANVQGNKSEKYSFTFKMSQDEMTKHYNTYVASEFYNYDTIMRQLRKTVSKCTTRKDNGGDND